MNKIVRLKTGIGHYVETQTELEGELNTFFQELLEEQAPDRGGAIYKVTQHIPALVSQEHNDLLMRPVEMQELEEVIKQMEGGKAPGPYNFTTNFFHSCWDMLKEEVLEIFEDSRRTGGVLSAFNATFLTLFPKETGAKDSSKFKPISL